MKLLSIISALVLTANTSFASDLTTIASNAVSNATSYGQWKQLYAGEPTCQIEPMTVMPLTNELGNSGNNKKFLVVSKVICATANRGANIEAKVYSVNLWVANSSNSTVNVESVTEFDLDAL